jgi:hypothetical protein
MRKFTKSLLTLALMVVAVGGAKAQTKVYATFANPSNTNAVWDANTSSFSWTQSWYNQIGNIGLPNGDISDYKKLVVDYEIQEGDQFRILFYQGGSNIAIYVTKANDGATGVKEINIYETLSADANYSADYILKCTEIKLSGAGNSGKVKINSMYLETYADNEEKPNVQPVADEADPGKPAGDFVDFTTAFPNLQPKIGIGNDSHPIVLGNGDVVVGARSKAVIADLSYYSKLTMVTSPNLKVVLYMNHEIEAQQNAGDYAAEDEGKYVFMNLQADGNGLIEVDLTQFNKRELNCIALPWDNSNKGTVWYLLLTEGTSYNMVMGSAGYSTFSCKKNFELPNGIEAYTAKIQDNKVVLAKIDGAVPADAGVILKATTGNYSLPFAASATALSENELKVSDGSVTGDGTIYVLANKNSVTGFYKLANGQKVPAGKAYLTKSGSAPEFLPFEGGVTGIETVKTAKANNEIFNLAGQRVAKTAKGLYIVNGKKVVVK